MELKRQTFQGIYNIVRFNWHFYLIASAIILFLNQLKQNIPESTQFLVYLIIIPFIITIFVSLIVSFYIYDISTLYQFYWLPNLDEKNVLNVHAGFDESSEILRSKFPHIKLSICDFYDPENHTEISIKRARKAFPPLESTIKVSTNQLPFSDNCFDALILIFAAHEIRDEHERIRFFKEINRVLKPTGKIYVTEHLRDFKNFLAYSIGAFHFYSKSSWLKTFESANISICEELKITPFVSTFILEKNGDAL